MLRILVLVTLVSFSFARLDPRSAVYPCPIFGLARLSHSWSCSKYIQCINGDFVEVNCAENLHFNAETGECQSPEEARCTVDDSVCPIHTDPSELVYLFSAQNCADYFLCFNNQPQQFNCGVGYAFDPERNICDRENLITCPNYDVECPFLGSHRIRNPFDCRRYFHCQDGVSFGAWCRDGLFFDAFSRTCVPKENAFCDLIFPTTIPNTSSEPITTPETTPRPDTTTIHSPIQ